MDGEESILNIANFIESTNPSKNRSVEEVLGKVAVSENVCADKIRLNPEAKVTGNHNGSKDTSKHKAVADLNRDCGGKEETLEVSSGSANPNVNYTEKKSVSAPISYRKDSMNTNTVVAKKSKPIPSHTSISIRPVTGVVGSVTPNPLKTVPGLSRVSISSISSSVPSSIEVSAPSPSSNKSLPNYKSPQVVSMSKSLRLIPVESSRGQINDVIRTSSSPATTSSVSIPVTAKLTVSSVGSKQGTNGSTISKSTIQSKALHPYGPVLSVSKLATSTAMNVPDPSSPQPSSVVPLTMCTSKPTTLPNSVSKDFPLVKQAPLPNSLSLLKTSPKAKPPSIPCVSEPQSSDPVSKSLVQPDTGKEALSLFSVSKTSSQPLLVTTSKQALINASAPTSENFVAHENLPSADGISTASDQQPSSVSSTQESSSTVLPPKPKAEIVQGSTPPCNSTTPVSELISATSQLSSDTPLYNTAKVFLSPDSLRNLCDGVQALDLSGETECTDTETLTLYKAVLNIKKLSTSLSTWSTPAFLPLTNISCRTLHCHNLQKLVYKEPNLKNVVLSKVGPEQFEEFDKLVDFYVERGDLFISENVSLVIYLYHRIRNVSLEHVLTKLHNVFVKMKQILSKTSTDPVYKTCVAKLTQLMNVNWEEQVILSEENGYDFDFLFTILMYWKKVKDNPTRLGPIKSDSAPTTTTDPAEVDETKDDQSIKANPPNVEPTSDSVFAKSKSDGAAVHADAVDMKTSPSKDSVKESKLSSGNNDVKSVREPSQEVIAGKAIEAEKRKAAHVEIPAMKPTHIPTSQVSVLSLHQLKTFLDQNSDPRQRVMRGVGQQAYKEFNNLVTSLQDMNMGIVDINVKTLYFTIINFANHPVTTEMRKFEPLSNFSLKCEPFHDLKNLMMRDANIRDIVTNQLGDKVVDRFTQLVDMLARTGSDFVLADQENNIVLYHRFRNCVVDNIMARLKVIHSKIQVVELTNPPSGFTIGVKMLKSLMATHFNGQVLMMEKSKFDFDFLTTILEVLQQCKDSDEMQGVKPVEKKNSHTSLINSILVDLADIGLVQSLDIMIGSDVCKEYVETLKAIENNTAELSLKELKALHSIKNAIFFYKNNLQCQDLPLTNMALEAEKFSHLLRFIGRDAGIRNTISGKYGEVALKELEALVTAHDERGDKFISKFVEKNVKLYHSLRNTALEKILRQISVVHGKVKNIDLPEAAKTSTQYHIAIKRLDSIVDSEFSKKILLIEELKFEFDFLSTILLVWRTETCKQNEATTEAKAKETGIEEKVNKEALAVENIKTETMQTIVINPELQNSVLGSKNGERQLRAKRPVSKVQQLLEVDEDPDDPKDVDFDPNYDEIIVEDELAPQNAQYGEKVSYKAQGPMVMKNWPAPTPQRFGGSGLTTINHFQQTPVHLPVVQSPKEDLVALDSASASGILTLPRSVPPSIATPTNPMLVSPGWGGEMPIKTKCSECPDKTSETIEQLIHHFSFMHSRDEIEKYIGQEDHCLVCNEEFKLKFNLIKHLGLVHGAVKINLSQSLRWTCIFCRKEFMADEYLRRHLIKLHLEKKFEASFLPLNNTKEIICQFCDKKFSYKSNLFCHIGVDHNKLPDILPNYNKNDFVDADDLKCRHCDYEGTLPSIKTHYLTTHCKESFFNMCQEEGLIAADLSCRYCQVTFGDQDTLLLHIGVDHNRIYRFITHFQGKNIDLVSDSNSALKFVARKASFDNEDLTVADIPDPLSTETVFIDTDQEISLGSPEKTEKPQIKIVSPSKLLSKTKTEWKSSNIVSNVSVSNNNTSKVSEIRKQPVFSPKSEYKLKRQDTSKWCNKCNKNFLASKYEAHIILKHLFKQAESKLKQEQSLNSCTGLQCPNKVCVKPSKFVNMESLLVHFVTKHTDLMSSELELVSPNGESHRTSRNEKLKFKKSNDAEIYLDISDEGDDPDKTAEAQTFEEKKSLLNSPWMDKFRTFCKISSLPEAKAMLSNNMKTINPIVLEKFLTHLCQTPSVIPQLEEVASALSCLFPKDNIKSLSSVVRHLLLQDYQKHCAVVGTTMQACNPMQVVIFLSQQLAKPGVKPEDLQWLVKWVSKEHDKVDGKFLIENKKVIEFFEAVGFTLHENQESVSDLQVKQEEPMEKPSFPCTVCGTRFNNSIGLVRHRDRCGVREVANHEEPTKPGKKLKSEEGIKKENDAKQIAAQFKAKRSSLGLGQKQVLAHLKNLLGPELKVQAIDVAKFEMNHSEQAMVKFLPVAQAWLKKLITQESPKMSLETPSQVKVKTEPAMPTLGAPTADSTSVTGSTPKIKDISVPKVDVLKLKVAPEDFTSSINLGTSRHNDIETVKESPKEISKKLSDDAINIPDIVEDEPECIDLDEEDKIYRYFCQECEGCVGSSTCDHTTHPRVPLQFDISTHIAKTGHVAVSPITGFLSLAPITDLAYTHMYGADVRKQWKDLVLAGSYIPSQFQGVKRCKWAACSEVFDDAVEAFKHIRDVHLKPKQTKAIKSHPLQSQLLNQTSKRKTLPEPSIVPASKIGKIS